MHGVDFDDFRVPGQLPWRQQQSSPKIDPVAEIPGEGRVPAVAYACNPVFGRLSWLGLLSV